MKKSSYVILCLLFPILGSAQNDAKNAWNSFIHQMSNSTSHAVELDISFRDSKSEQVIVQHKAAAYREEGHMYNSYGHITVQATPDHVLIVNDETETIVYDRLSGKQTGQSEAGEQAQGSLGMEQIMELTGDSDISLVRSSEEHITIKILVNDASIDYAIVTLSKATNIPETITYKLKKKYDDSYDEIVIEYHRLELNIPIPDSIFSPDKFIELDKDRNATIGIKNYSNYTIDQGT